MVTARWPQVTWKKFAPTIGRIEDLYRHVLDGDQAGYEGDLEQQWLRSDKYGSLVALVQLNVATVSLGILAQHEAGLGEDDLAARFRSWDSFIVNMADERIERELVRYALNPYEPLAIKVSSHWEYLTTYVATFVAVGAFGLAHSPSPYANWVVEFDGIVKMAERTYKRRLLRQLVRGNSRTT